MQPKEVRLGVGMKTYHEEKVQCNYPDSVGYRGNQSNRKAGESKESSYLLLFPLYLFVGNILSLSFHRLQACAVGYHIILQF